MDNPETQATLSTRHRIKTNKTKTHNTENYKDEQQGDHRSSENIIEV
jgi:hypothetical protein